MLTSPEFVLEDRDDIAALVQQHPWAAVASAVDGIPVVSHAPVLLDDAEDDAVSIISHLARPDARSHRLGEVEMVVVVQGPHGYVTPSWYPQGTYVPTWNFVVVHLHGVAEVLDAEATWDVLERTVERFEAERPHPWSLATVTDYAHRIAPGTVGFRLEPSRIVAKAKLSQDKPEGVVRSVITGLDRDEVHGNTGLAATMRSQLPAADGERT